MTSPSTFVYEPSLSARQPKDWVPSLKTPFPLEELSDLKNHGLSDESIAKIVNLQRRFIHLVREKVAVGNINGISLETKIFRTMTCEDFHLTIQTGKLHLTNPLRWAEWGDTWEAAIISGGVFTQRTDDEKVVPITNLIREKVKNWYGQSWSLTEENDAIWNRYTQSNHRAVRISTTVRKLMLALFRDETFARTTFLDKVLYLSNLEIDLEKTSLTMPFEEERSIRRLLSLKRQAYHYENEVRLLFFDSDQQNVVSQGLYYDFPLDGKLEWPSFIESVTLDPDCPDSCIEAESAFLKSCGLYFSVEKSPLKKPSLAPAIVHFNNRC